MSQAVTSTMSPDEFLAWDREQRERHHYVRGHVFDMSGGSARHSFLGAQMIIRLGSGLRGRPCDVHTADLRLGIANDHFVYADAVVVCRPIALRPGTSDVVTNPSLVVEVLSKSTEAYDRGDKLAGYLALVSVQHILLVSQRERRIEMYTRQHDGSFRFEVHGTGSAIHLELLDVSIPVDDLYGSAFELPGDA